MGGGTAGRDRVILHGNGRRVRGWRLRLSSRRGQTPCYRANGSGRGGAIFAFGFAAGLGSGFSGLSPAQTRRTSRWCRRRGCRLRTPAPLKPSMQNTPDAPASAPTVPLPSPEGRFGVAARFLRNDRPPALRLPARQALRINFSQRLKAGAQTGPMSGRRTGSFPRRAGPLPAQGDRVGLRDNVLDMFP